MNLIFIVLICVNQAFVTRVDGWYVRSCAAFRTTRSKMKTTLLSTPFGDDGVNSGVEEYRNSVTKVLSNLIQKEKMEYGVIVKSSSAEIDFASPKISSSTSLETLAAALDFELSEKEWFVTGNINPCYFSDNFQFQDPDVKVVGIEEYSKGVKKIFDQTMSRAEIISTVISETSTPKNPVITCTWRLSGRVNIGPGLDIKPYIVSTDFEVDPQTSLIVSQEDRFDIPAWDILLR